MSTMTIGVLAEQAGIGLVPKPGLEKDSHHAGFGARCLDKRGSALAQMLDSFHLQSADRRLSYTMYLS